jgi:antitoxin (DNA-binding transcriptional repressor) of toxin-antitoxin stability system
VLSTNAVDRVSGPIQVRCGRGFRAPGSSGEALWINGDEGAIVRAGFGVAGRAARNRELPARAQGRNLCPMKTLTVSKAKARLGGLVDEVQQGAPVILVHGDKLAKLERYELLDPDADSPRVEAMLLEAVEGPHAPYSQAEMDAVLRKALRESRKR